MQPSVVGRAGAQEGQGQGGAAGASPDGSTVSLSSVTAPRGGDKGDEVPRAQEAAGFRGLGGPQGHSGFDLLLLFAFFQEGRGPEFLLLFGG